MHPDISRTTFRPERHVAGLVMQQGRVQLDADWNEQAAIQQYRDAQVGRATIGRVGAAKDATGGFGLQVAAGGGDLLIGAGELWVDGIALENTPQPVGATAVNQTSVVVDRVDVDGQPLAAGQTVLVLRAAGATAPISIAAVNAATRTVTLGNAVAGMAANEDVRIRRVPSLRAQPHSRDSLPAPAGNLPAGQYAVFVDAWLRELTATDEPLLRETALNGLDTVTRQQVAWRVDLRRIGAAGGMSCADVPLGALPAPSTGRLVAVLDAPGGGPDPCILPDAGGYRGLEHQLYRVEVHRIIGTDIVLKWQRDNAHLASPVDAVGTTFHVDDLGPDPVAGFQDDGFVELTDDRLTLAQRSGDLFKISSIQRAVRQIQGDTAFNEPHAETAVTRAANAFRPRARRWDGRIVASTAAPADLELEHGLFVRIVPGTFREGDYWLIPARTATTVDPGTVEWPRDAAGAPLGVAPHGAEHHTALIGLVDVDATGFLPGTLLDCRPRFPALTDIDASDVAFDPAACGFENVTDVQQAIDALCQRSGGGTCSRTAAPGAGWESVFAGLPAGASAEICLPIGAFPLAAPVEIAGTGHLLVHGAGWGSQIDAPTADEALIFRGWASVTVRDLAVSTGVGPPPPSPNPVVGLRGALSFHACDRVVVDSVRTRTAPRTVRSVSGISIYRAASARGVDVRVSHCAFEVGERQVGLLGVNLNRFVVEHNVLEVVGSNRVVADIGDLSAGERRAMMKLLYRGLERGPAAGRQRGVIIGGQPYRFETLDEAGRFWDAALPNLNTRDVDVFGKEVSRAIRAVLSGADRSARGLELATFLRDRIARRRVPAMAQGIVAGGQIVGDVTIRDNRVSDAIQGIHVGASRRAPRTGPTDVVDRVSISGNRVGVTIPAEGARGRHGIFVGNAESIVVRENELTYTSHAPRDPVTSTGIRIFGFVDRMLNVRENHVEDFGLGIHVVPLLRRGAGQFARTRLYRVAENVLVLPTSPPIRVEGPLSSKVTVVDNRP